MHSTEQDTMPDFTLDLAAAQRCRDLLWQRIRIARARPAWLGRRRLAALQHEAMLLDIVVESLSHADGPASVAAPADLLPTVYALHRGTDEPAPAHTDADESPSLRWLQVPVTLVVVAIILVRWLGAGGPLGMHAWLFLEDVEHVTALGFEPGDERAGTWRLEHHAAATGRRALVNHQGAADAPPATAVWSGRTAADVLVRTRCTVAGTGVEQACGVVFGWQDEGDHLVARVDLGTHTLVVSAVEHGVERVLGKAPIGDVDASWHELVVRAQGERVTVRHHDGARIEIDIPHSRGRVGLWAPSGSTAYFDELLVHPLS